MESSSPELSLPEQSYESVEEVPDFYVQVLMMYGAAEDPETQELHPLHVSLFYGDGWKDGSELTAGDAYCWFLSFVNALPQEEKEERYASPLGENQGWFFPEEELESTMSAWFEGVTPEQFRADSNFYDAEHHGCHGFARLSHLHAFLVENVRGWPISPGGRNRTRFGAGLRLSRVGLWALAHLRCWAALFAYGIGVYRHRYPCLYLEPETTS